MVVGCWGEGALIDQSLQSDYLIDSKRSRGESETPSPSRRLRRIDRAALLSRVEWMENQNSKSQGALVRAGEGEGSSCWSHTSCFRDQQRRFCRRGSVRGPGLLSSSSPPQVRLLKVSVQGSRGLCLNAGQGLVLVKLSVFLEYVSRENVVYFKMFNTYNVQ